MTRQSIFADAIRVLVVYLLVNGNVHAGGLYVTQLATPGSVGTGGVINSVNNFGADSAWTNPAGMIGLERDAITFGMQTISADATLDVSIAEAGGTDGGNIAPPTLSPSFFGVKVLSDRWRLGVGSSGLMGGGVDYGNSFAGRYAVNKAKLAGLGLSTSLGYRVSEKLSVGIGVSLIYTILDEDISVRQPGFQDGEIVFDKIDDTGFQGFAGLQYQVNDRLLLGLVYRSKSDVELSGDLDFKRIVIPFDFDGDIDVEWENPQVLELGLRYWITPKFSVAANIDWEDWSEFSANQLAVSIGPVSRATTIERRWTDTYHGGIAFIYETGKHNFGAGIGYDTSPVADRDRTLDLAIDEQFKFALGYHRDREQGFDYSFAVTMIHAGDAAVDQTAQGVRVRTETDTNLIFFVGGSVSWQF